MPLDNSENIYRRGWIKQQNADGSPTSRVFKPRDIDKENLSVDIKSLSSRSESIKDEIRFILFEGNCGQVQTVKNIKGESLTIEKDPIDGNKAHALIIRITEDDDETPLILSKIFFRV